MAKLYVLHLAIGTALCPVTLLDFSSVAGAQTVQSTVASPALENSFAQVNSVSQLSDVQPTDWAFQALQSLVERYGCIAGYPDGTYRGNRAMTRYEFAAGLNACMGRVNELIEGATDDAVSKEDLAKLQRLQEEFAAELATLRGRADSLDVKTATLEAQQFSPTTKLKGEVIFSLSGAMGQEKADGSGEDIERNWVFDNRVRLSFNTSFTGKDLLKVRLDALNTTPFGINVTGTDMTRLAFDAPTGNSVRIGRLFYRFPLSPQLKVTIDAAEGRYDTAVETFNPFFSSPYKGAISNFGRFNPIYIQGRRGAGVTASYDLSRAVNFSLGYMARNAAEPTENNGLFDGSFAALAQLAVKPSDALKLGITYVRAYYPQGKAFVTGRTGSQLANAPFGPIATSANQFGLESTWKVDPKFTLSGWAGWTQATAQGNGLGFERASVAQGDKASILNWAVTLAFPDLGKKGNLAGLIIGQQPRVIQNDGGPEDSASSWQFEALYEYRVNPHLILIPGVLVIVNPENNSNSSTIVVGNVRAVFEF